MKFKTLRNIVKARRMFVKTVLIIVGVTLISAAIMFFLLPNQISTGGFSGVALILFYFLNIPVGLSVMALNIPLFIIVLIKGGKKYFFKVVFGTAMLSVMLSIFSNLQPMTEDRLLASMYGGVLSGAGTAIIFRARSSTRRNRLVG